MSALSAEMTDVKSGSVVAASASITAAVVPVPNPTITDVPTNTVPVEALLRDKPDVVYYHGPCPDGQTARAILQMFYRPELRSIQVPSDILPVNDLTAAIALAMQGLPAWEIEKIGLNHGDQTFEAAKCMYLRDVMSEDTIDYRPYMHGRPEEWKKLAGKVVWFVDVCPTAEVLKNKALSEVKKCVIIDHHSNPLNRELCASIEKGAFGDRVSMFLDNSTKVCGALMLYGLLYGQAVPIPRWLDVINKGDTGQLRTDEDYAYQCFLTRDAAMSTQRSTDVINAIHARMAPAMDIGTSLAAEYRKKAIPFVNALQIRAKPLVWEGRSYVVGVIKHVPDAKMMKCITDLAWKAQNSGESKAGPFELLFLEWVSDSGIANVSLRRRADIELDLSEVARVHGGGGHPPASGVQHMTVDGVGEVKKPITVASPSAVSATTAAVAFAAATG